jgi:hypothetical protein
MIFGESANATKKEDTAAIKTLGGVGTDSSIKDRESRLKASRPLVGFSD